MVSVVIITNAMTVHRQRRANTQTFLEETATRKGLTSAILPDFLFSDNLFGVLKSLIPSIVAITLGPIMKTS